MGQHVVVGGIISPVHDSYGKKELESATQRLAMVKLALANHDWVRLSDWECKQETWSRTRQVLQYHQVITEFLDYANVFIYLLIDIFRIKSMQY